MAERPQITVNVPLPSKFDADVPNVEGAWKKFERSWSTYEVASRLSTQDDAYRAAVFTSCLSDASLDVLDSFKLTDAEKKNITVLRNKFREYCVGETCEVSETYKFHQRKQTPGETIDTYVGPSDS
jgi:hypothetical protein